MKITNQKISYNFIAPQYLVMLQDAHSEPLSSKIKEKATVTQGQELTHSRHDYSAVYSPVSGRVKKISHIRYPGEEHDTPAMLIDFEGRIAHYGEKKFDINSQSANKALEKIKRASVYDNFFGYYYPILESALQSQTDTIVVFAMDPHPLSMLEEFLVATESHKIAQALSIVCKLFEARNQEMPHLTIIAQQRKTGHILKKALKAHIPQVLRLLKILTLSKKTCSSFYASSNTKVGFLLNLYRETLKMSAEDSGSNLMLTHPSTLLQIYDAVWCSKPVIDKYIQFTYSREHNMYIKTSLGTPLYYLFKEFLPSSEHLEQVYLTTILQSKHSVPLSLPIMKSYSHVYALSNKEFSLLYGSL